MTDVTHQLPERTTAAHIKNGGPHLRVLVTGGAGFIGSHLAASLASAGHSVWAIDSYTQYYDRDQKEANLRLAQLQAGGRIEFEELDVHDLDASRLRECDAVIHLAAQPGVRLSWEAFETYSRQNISATDHLAKEAIGAGVNRVVFASSSSIYGDLSEYPTRETSPTWPRSPYGVTKLACEKLLFAYCQNADLSVAALRFFTVYGPGQRPDMAIHRLLSPSTTQFRLFGDGHQRRDFTYVADVVKACMAAAESPEVSKFEAFNIGGSGDTSMLELIALARTVTKREIDIALEPAQAGDVLRTGADYSHALNLLGWRPETPLNIGLMRHARFLASGSVEDWQV